MLGNGNGKQRLVEDWSEDEATFVSVPGRQSGHTKVDIVKVSLMLFCETDKIFCWYLPFQCHLPSGPGQVLRTVQHGGEDVRAGRGGLGRGRGCAVPDPRLPRLPGTARWVWRQRRRRTHL